MYGSYHKIDADALSLADYAECVQLYVHWFTVNTNTLSHILFETPDIFPTSPHKSYWNVKGSEHKQ